MAAFYECFIDGACRNNGSKEVEPEAACAAMIYKNKKEVFRFARELGNRTNNQAEYEALILCLTMCIAADIPRPIIYSDSQVVVNQMNGVWESVDPGLLPFYLTATRLKANYNFDLVKVPRSKVFYPDELCNQVLDELQLAKAKQIEAHEKKVFLIYDL